MVAGIKEVLPIWLKRRRQGGARRRHPRRERSLRFRPLWCKMFQEVAKRKSAAHTLWGAYRELAPILSAWSGEPVSPNRIKQWAYGVSLPRPSMYRPLASYMDMTTDEFIDLIWPRPGGPYQGPVTADQARRLVTPLGKRRQRRPRCKRKHVDVRGHPKQAGPPPLGVDGAVGESPVPALPVLAGSAGEVPTPEESEGECPSHNADVPR